MVWPQMAPASEWKIASRPMNTTTTDSIGRIVQRPQDHALDRDADQEREQRHRGNAIQKLTPHSSSCQHR